MSPGGAQARANDLMAEAGALRADGHPAALARAEALLREAVRVAPRSAAALSNHGLLLSDLGRHAQAAQRQREALALAPQLASAWFNLALALHHLGDRDAAEAAQQRAQQLEPGSLPALVARGRTALGQGGLDAALALFRAALQRDAGVPEVWVNLGLALQAAGDSSAALAALQRAQALAPHDRRAVGNLLLASQYHAPLDAAALRALATLAAAAWPSAGVRPVARPHGGPLRLGYLGGDFYSHPVGWLLAPVLEAHDPAVVQVQLFDDRLPGSENDPLAQRLRAAAARVHDIAGQDDASVAAAVREAGIDVLVELSGHTQRGRLGVLALQPAPVQLSWLGYFGSTGVPAVDAVLIGTALAPPGTEAGYTEALERLPGAHFAYAPPPAAPLPAPPPSAHTGVVTFGSFNNPAKLGDGVVALWARVLQQVPGSRLLLKWQSLADPAFAAHTRHRFAVRGIAPERISLQPASPHAELLATYAEVDIALDPFPFSGLITTLEALWMGVPVLTLPGPRPVSRQTLAVLQAIGLDEGAVATPAAYADRAAAWAADLPRRQAWRGAEGAEAADALRTRLRRSALGDARPLARALEAVCRRRFEAALP